MIKVTALALFMALCNAEKETTESNGPSRLLLQFGAPQQQQQPGFGPSPGGANPYAILNSPMCQYDPQNCIDMLQNMYQNPYYGQPPFNPYYNPYQQYQQPQQQYPVPQQPQVNPVPVAQPPATGTAPAPAVGNPSPSAPVDPLAPGANPGLNPPPPPQVGAPGAGQGQGQGQGPPTAIGQPGQVLPPVNGGLPGQPPMGGLPGQPPMGGVPPVIPGMPGLLGVPVTEINCGPPPATPCGGRTAGSLLGPLNIGAGMANNFKLYCDTPGVCAGSTINADIRPNPANPGGVRAIEQILCSEPGACQGTTANIKNLQGNGNNIELSNLECGTGACGGLTINGWGVSLNDVNCPTMADCMGCVFNNMKTAPDAFCADPFAPNAPSNPMCIIESIPCFGY